MVDTDGAHPDALINFLFDQLPVRGVLFQMDEAWREIVSLHDYVPEVRTLLGEVLAATTMMGSTMKLSGMLTLQLQAGAGLGMLIAQCDPRLRYRGMAGESTAPAGGGFASLAGGGRLSVTVEARDPRDRYQGIVPVSGASMADTLRDYYRDSAQLDAHFVLLVDEHRAAGLMLQKMPDASGMESDHWHRLTMLADTLQLDELRSGVSSDLLRKLFAEDDLVAFDARVTGFHCRCSDARAEKAVRMLGQEDAQALLLERDGCIEITCEFCNRRRTLDAVDVRRLFATEIGGGHDGTIH